MDPDEDEHVPPGQEQLDITDQYHKVKDMKPSAKGGKITDQARRMVKHKSVCSLFCGGKKCKYCTVETWSPEQQAINGIFSHWVTDNILAMARPTNSGIKKYGIIQQFLKKNIKTVINLQQAGEHAFCGDGNEKSGFSYSPQLFMEKEIFFYNFGWDDFGVGSVTLLLDIVKVMQFALSLGKVTIHCHAGLGRTGLLIACYLVYNNRLSPTSAVHYVRSKRPGAIQTVTQVEMVSEFESFIRPFRLIFAIKSESYPEFNLQQHLNRQRHLLHGFEGRKLKYLPKIIYICCERLLELANCGNALSRSVSFTSLSSQNYLMPPSTTETLRKSLSYMSVRSDNTLDHSDSNMETHRSVSFETLNSDKMKSIFTNAEPKRRNGFGSCESFEKPKQKTVSNLSAKYSNGRLLSDGVSDQGSDSRSTYSLSDSTDLLYPSADDDDDVDCPLPCLQVGEALRMSEYSKDILTRVEQIQVELNTTDEAWKTLSNEQDPLVLAAILWEWLDHLREPVLRKQDVTHIKADADKPTIALQKIDKGTKGVIEYLAKVMVKLDLLPRNLRDQIIERILSHVTHQAVCVKTSSMQRRKKEHWTDMKEKTAMRLFYFFHKLINTLLESGAITAR